MPACTCTRCDAAFWSDDLRCYCDECVEDHHAVREKIHERQNPAPGVHADGQFAKPIECPETICDEYGRPHCGLCGSPDVEHGYGIGGGYGIGSYMFCMNCYAFLDFREDKGE